MDRWLADPVLLGWLECTIELRSHMLDSRDVVVDLGCLAGQLETIWRRKALRRLGALRARLGQLKVQALEQARLPKNRAERRALKHRGRR